MKIHDDLIYLADLTHTTQIVAANVFPLGIGLIGSYLIKENQNRPEIELFKYPEDLNKSLIHRMPRIIGFANYSWNCDISYQFARRIKEESPETIVVFGGPNYGLTAQEEENFWNAHPLIDFYVVKEGEKAFHELYRRLKSHHFDITEVKRSDDPPPSCHYLLDNQIVRQPLLPRLSSLDEIGSPYLIGLMDKFFDGVLIPMIHTTRGCPFTCTFCTEGSPYYSKVAQGTKLEEDLEYIAQRRGTVQDIYLSDANFGMYLEDKAKAEIFAQMQKKCGYPKRIGVSTGKNAKERIISVAAMLNGALNIAASLQSTNQEILGRIKRRNISTEALTEIVKMSNEADAQTYTELILSLPGDSIQTHVQSLRDVTEAGFDVVRMYQLILLPQTELNTHKTRAEYGMETRFRLNPRSFGKYEILGQQVAAVESEEICVATNALPFEDYIKCREWDLTVEILHNAGMFHEVFGLCKWLGISWFDCIAGFYERRRDSRAQLAELYDLFVEENHHGLWHSLQELERDVRTSIDDYVANTEGTNEMSKGKARAFYRLMEELHEVLYEQIGEVIAKAGRSDEVMTSYLRELKQLSLMRKSDLLDTSASFYARFHFDFQAIDKCGYACDPHAFHSPSDWRIQHSEAQVETIQSYINQYGKTLDGLGRILMRTQVRKLFRSFSVVGSSPRETAAAI